LIVAFRKPELPVTATIQLMPRSTVAGEAVRDG
jgi:hypothetical protein